MVIKNYLLAREHTPECSNKRVTVQKAEMCDSWGSRRGLSLGDGRTHEHTHTHTTLLFKKKFEKKHFEIIFFLCVNF
jgi:hypothetical protein